MKNIGKVIGLYPMPLTIVGTKVDGKINFINIAHTGILGLTQMMVSMGKYHYSTKGVLEHKTLSISLVGKNLVKEADYVGLVSGSKVDKSNVFNTFEGELTNAPLIKDALITMECKVVDVYDSANAYNIVVEPVNTYVNEEYVDQSGKFDYLKAEPLLFEGQKRRYISGNKEAGQAFSIGKEVK